MGLAEGFAVVVGVGVGVGAPGTPTHTNTSAWSRAQSGRLKISFFFVIEVARRIYLCLLPGSIGNCFTKIS
jgi:hypothetical protein